MGLIHSSHTHPARTGQRSWLILAVISLAVGLLACSPSRTRVEPSPAGARPKVLTTFLPVTLLTRAVAGDCAEVEALVPPAVGPHDFQARPADLLALRKARVLVKNGLGVETFLDALITAAANPRLLVIDSSRGVATIANQDSHGHGAVNPHIWLDPLRAIQQVETIRAGLSLADPACAEGYGRRAAATTARLQTLHGELARQLRPFQGRAFVAFHDVAPYFAKRYGLKAVFLVDVPEMNPTPGDLQRVTAVVKENRIGALLREPLASNGSFSALARDLGLGIGTFDPLETGTAEASRNPDTYFETMRRNGDNLVKAFGTEGRRDGGSR